MPAEDDCHTYVYKVVPEYWYKLVMPVRVNVNEPDWAAVALIMIVF